MNLSNKIIVVTGGNGLIGKSIVKYIGDCDAQVISVDIQQSVENEFNRVADLTDESLIKEVIDKIINDFGRIDGWVNNAYPRTEDWGNKLEEVTVNSWRQNVDLQLTGYFLCSKLVLERMKINRSGSLVNMSSIYGSVGPDFTIYDGTSMTIPVAYSAIKGGLVNLSRYLASYFGPDNLRVNCVSPGGIFDYQPESFVSNYNRKVPLRRMGKPEDIAPSVAFLLSDDASYITGVNLHVDGGWTAI